jgi:hypothetical protein
MPSFRMPFVLSMCFCALVACTATPPTEAQAPKPDVADARATTAMPPPGASGKLSPEMVGKVSPVPAFMGQGGRGAKRWMIDIRSEGEMRHRVEITWMATHVRMEGEAFYRGTPAASTRGAPIALDGGIDTSLGEGTMRMRIGIFTESCIDDAGVTHPQRVTVSLQGEAELSGCGELAVY